VTAGQVPRHAVGRLDAYLQGRAQLVLAEHGLSRPIESGHPTERRSRPRRCS
jgi:hypothetical protein